MNILIAPDSFKGCMSASEFCEIAEEAIHSIIPSATVTRLPMADGGEGTVEAIVAALEGQIIDIEVTAPHGEKVWASYGYMIDQGLAVIEMASASGLPLVPLEARNPMIATTYGTGELIKDALDRGCKKILLGIGGSATNDGGLGALTALGAVFTDSSNQLIPQGGEGCLALHRIDITGLDTRLKDVVITIACDVENTLYGPNGAAYVYGVQKGASEEDLVQLDLGLRNMSKCIEDTFGCSIEHLAGGGAAGGFGAGFVGILGATLMPGFEIINRLLHVDRRIQGGNFDLIITGEGQVNHQTIQGKLPYQIAKMGQANKCPVICIAGSVRDMDPELYACGLTAVFPIVDSPMSLEEAMTRAPELLKNLVENIMRLYRNI